MTEVLETGRAKLGRARDIGGVAAAREPALIRLRECPVCLVCPWREQSALIPPSPKLRRTSEAPGLDRGLSEPAATCELVAASNELNDVMVSKVFCSTSKRV